MFGPYGKSETSNPFPQMSGNRGNSGNSFPSFSGAPQSSQYQSPPLFQISSPKNQFSESQNSPMPSPINLENRIIELEASQQQQEKENEKLEKMVSQMQQTIEILREDKQQKQNLLQQIIERIIQGEKRQQALESQIQLQINHLNMMYRELQTVKGEKKAIQPSYNPEPNSTTIKNSLFQRSAQNSEVEKKTENQTVFRKHPLSSSKAEESKTVELPTTSLTARNASQNNFFKKPKTKKVEEERDGYKVSFDYNTGKENIISNLCYQNQYGSLKFLCEQIDRSGVEIFKAVTISQQSAEVVEEKWKSFDVLIEIWNFCNYQNLNGQQQEEIKNGILQLKKESDVQFEESTGQFKWYLKANP